jgi:FkbM family methyltransferase
MRLKVLLSVFSRNPRLKIIQILSYSDLSPMAGFEKYGWNRSLFNNISLPENPLILNIGGFKGDSTEFLFNTFGGKIHVVEPIPQYIEILRNRFSENRNIVIIPKALGSDNSQIELSVSDDMTGAFANGHSKIWVDSIGITHLINDLGSKPDLILMNIEGGEFDVLEEMLKTRETGAFPNLCIQFHNVFPAATERRERIREILSLNHNEVINFPWVWEVWRAK